jgi:hypothetical protein
MTANKEKKDVTEIVSWGIIAAFLTLYGWIVFAYASFMPIQDDYSAALGFLERYYQLKNPIEKIKLFLTPNADHRIPIPMIIEFLQYKLTGEIDFRLLIVIGNLGWLATLFLLWHYATYRLNMTTLQFLPVPLFMLSFAHASLMTWSLGSLQQYWQLFFSVAALYALVTHKRLFAYMLTLFAVFTGGGGFALFPVWIVYDIVHKRWKGVLTTLMFATAIIFVYFVILPYRFPATPAWNMTGEVIRTCLSYAVVFLGSAAGNLTLAAVVGVTMISLWLVFIKTMHVRSPFLFYTGLFIVIIAALTAKARCLNGVQQALSSRYTIYALLFLSINYLFLESYIRRRIVWSIGMIGGLLLMGFHFYDKLPRFEQRKIIAERKLDFFLTPFAEERLRNALKMHYFTSWRKQIVLPSELSSLPVTDDKANYSIIIDGNISLSPHKAAQPLKLFASLPFRMQIEGFAYDDTGKPAYGLLFLLRSYGQFRTFDSVTYHSFPMHVRFGMHTYVDFPALNDRKIHLDIHIIDSNASKRYQPVILPFHLQPLHRLAQRAKKTNRYAGEIERVKKTEKGWEISGWFAYKGERSDNFFLIAELNNQYYIARYGIVRPDVAKALQDTRYLHSGFTLDISKKDITSGHYPIKFYFISLDHQRQYATNERNVTLTY